MTADAIDLALELVDQGVFARRGQHGEPVPNRAAVTEVENRLREERIDLTMWTLHNRCKPGHLYEAHRWMAEQIVHTLFPPAVMT